MNSPQVPADDEEFTTETRDAWPAHFWTTIKSFSLLSKHGISKIESMEFDAGEYKWKLIIYPDGDEKAKKAKYISVYLSLVGTASLPGSWVVNAIINFFLYNHISDKYLCFRGKVRRLHAINSEWGISKLMTKECFTEPSNGYILNDKCVFGAEVFVIKNHPAVENVSLLAHADPYKRVWEISDFSKQQNVWNSPEFDARGYKWKIMLYPNGDSEAKGRYISIFLECVDAMNFGVDKKFRATYLFIIINNQKIIHSKKVTHWFTSQQTNWGFVEFMAIGDAGAFKSLMLRDCLLEIQLSIEAIQEPLKLE